MTKNKNRVFFISLLFLLAVTVFTLTFIPRNSVKADYVYTQTTDGIALSEINAVSGSVLEIPASIDGKTVVEIKSGAVKNLKDVTSVTVPNTVTKIGRGAFTGLKYLESITLPFVGGSSNSVGAESSFGYIFGNNVNTGDYTLQNYSETESSVFYIPYKLKIVEITGGTLGYGAFSNCVSIETVKLGGGITEVPDYAFKGAIALTTVTLPETVTTIGEKAFYNTAVENINLGKIKSFGKMSFANTKLNSLTLTDAEIIGEKAFSGNAKLAVVALGENLTAIGDYAFSYLSLLKTVDLPNGLTSVGKGVFYQNTRLTSVNANGIAFVSEDGVLYSKDKTELIVYPAMKTGTEFSIPDSVTKVYENAFNGNKFLKTLSVGTNITEIGYSAFSQMPSLKTLNLKFNGGSANATGERAQNGYLFGELPFEGCKVENVNVDGVDKFYCLPLNLTISVA